MSRLGARVLDGVERAGNLLPHPFWLFCGLFLFVGLLSAGFDQATVARPETRLADRAPAPTLDLRRGVSGRHTSLQLELARPGQPLEVRPIQPADLAAVPIPAEVERVRLVDRPPPVVVRSLVSREGLQWFVLNIVENFAGFEPLGIVLVMLMGVAVAEGTGLVATTMRALAAGVPPSWVTPVLFGLAACGNIGSDAGIVVIPPLAAAIFRQLGRNPIGGLLVGYVGATAGFTANLLPAGTDVLAMSLTNAATGGEPEVNVFCNSYFMATSVFFLAGVGTLVTHRVVLPRLGDAPGAAPVTVSALTAAERRGLAAAWVAVGLGAALWLATLLPEGGLLRSDDPDPAMFWRSPFFKGLVPILFTLFVAGGVVYGRVAGTLTAPSQIVDHMTASMKRMGGYIVLVLVIAQFIRAFQWSRLDEAVAILGADGLRALGMEEAPVPFIVAFIGVVAVANLFMGSASAKWALFAPIFVPMFMGIGLHPAFTQLLYRMGDSITNCCSPLYPFFPVLLGWIAEVDPERAKVGTVLSYLIPYALWLMVGWIGMLLAWYALGLPVGPDSPIWL